MFATISHKGKTYRTDLDKPIDISMPLRAAADNVTAWYVKPPEFEPVVMGDWVGDVNRGGSVNFRNIFFNPHGHGTHTECAGHISKERFTIYQSLRNFFFLAELVTVLPDEAGADRVITRKHIETVLGVKRPEALVIRTVPNPLAKLTAQYSNTNPPYLHHEAAELIRVLGITHLLIDLPSVDKERDEGKLLAHRAFWHYPEQTRTEATITELIYVPNNVLDGSYLLNLQVASFENDAAPSKPVLYQVVL